MTRPVGTALEARIRKTWPRRNQKPEILDGTMMMMFDGRFWLPRVSRMTFYGAETDVTLDIEVVDEESVMVTRVLIERKRDAHGELGNTAVEGIRLRDLSYSALAASAMAPQGMRKIKVSPSTGRFNIQMEHTKEIEDAAYDCFRRYLRTRRRVTADALTEVAEVYRRAAEAGVPPTKAVSETLNMSRSKAAKMVSQARASGMLPPTTPGKAQA
jgi:hypothetical protein